MLTVPWLKLMLAVSALLVSQSALAGSVSFGLSVTGSQLNLTNEGNVSAFYPAVFRMLPDGSWEPLKASNAPAQFAVGASMQLTWSDAHPVEKLDDLERMEPVMVRFFDQSGVEFGQITFLRPPPTAKTPLKAGYVNGSLQVEPPAGTSSIRASWVLWPQDEGIGPIRFPVRFVHRAPPARRVDWARQGSLPFRLDTGAGQPVVILLHETEQGYAQQFVPNGGHQGREQRAAWLDAAPQLYAASLISLGLAVGAIVLQYLYKPRAPTTSGRTNL